MELCKFRRSCSINIWNLSIAAVRALTGYNAELLVTKLMSFSEIPTSRLSSDSSFNVLRVIWSSKLRDLYPLSRDVLIIGLDSISDSSVQKCLFTDNPLINLLISLMVENKLNLRLGINEGPRVEILFCWSFMVTDDKFRTSRPTLVTWSGGTPWFAFLVCLCFLPPLLWPFFKPFVFYNMMW